MSDVKAPGWKELTIGGLILEAGSAEEYETGDWRSKRPIVDKDKCISCLSCWIVCPDSSIIVEDAKMVGINYKYCKGCGVCASVCPPKVRAITMENESDFR